MNGIFIVLDKKANAVAAIIEDRDGSIIRNNLTACAPSFWN